MSGFASKLSAAGSKGWTGLQSLWDREPKAPVSSSHSGPGEKTSLLSLALPSRHPRGSRLLSEEDDWGDSVSADNGGKKENASKSTPTPSPTPTPTTTLTSPSGTKSQPMEDTTTMTMTTTTTTTTSEWPGMSEDEVDVWLQGDSAQMGILDTDKKKTVRESKRPSPRFKHKLTSSSKGSDRKQDRGFSSLGKPKGPSFGKLLDCDSDEGEVGEVAASGPPSTSAGCDNKVWADDDDDDEAQWRMMDARAMSK